MKRWEYHSLTFDSAAFGWFSDPSGTIDLDSMHKQMNAMGEQGWELTSAFDTNRVQGGTRSVILLFKREIPQD